MLAPATRPNSVCSGIRISGNRLLVHLKPNWTNAAGQMVQQCINENHDSQHLQRFFDHFTDHVRSRQFSVPLDQWSSAHFHPNGSHNIDGSRSDKEGRGTTIDMPEKGYVADPDDADEDQ